LLEKSYYTRSVKSVEAEYEHHTRCPKDQIKLNLNTLKSVQKSEKAEFEHLT
jgi:hypothetical protein